MQIIYILWLRQLKRYSRSHSRIIGSLGQPILFLLALGFGFGPIYSKAGQGNYIQFLAPGIIAMGILFTSIFSGIEIIWDRQFGFLKETLVAPVPRWQIMLGRSLGGATVAVFQGLIILLISFIAGFTPYSPAGILWAFIMMILTANLFTALGSAIASLMDDAHGFQLIMNFLIMPLFFLSGAIFPLKDLPLILSWIVKIDPLTYGVDGLRGTLTGIYHFSLLTDFTVLILLTVILLGVGSYLFSRIQI